MARERFDFAISFAGPQRVLARDLTAALTSRGYRVFFDELFEHEMLGRDGTEYLRRVYFQEAKYCIALLSEEYDRRAWTRLEREAVEARELEDGSGFLIPILTDGSRPAWLLPSRIYFDLAQRSLQDLVILLARKVEPAPQYTVVARIEDLFARGPLCVCRREGTEDFLIRCQASQDGVQPVVRLARNEQATWSAERLAFAAQGPFMCADDRTALVAREPWEGPPLLYDLVRGERRVLQVPRSYKWDMVTCSDRLGEATLFGYCGGDVWLLDGHGLREVRQGSDAVAYVSAAFYGPNRIVCGSDHNNTIELRSTDGTLLRHFLAPDMTSCIAGFPAQRRIVLGGAHRAVILSEEGEVLFEHQAAAQGIFGLSAAPAGVVCAYTNGLPVGGNSVEVLDVASGERVYSERAPIGETWWSIAVSRTGAFIALARENTVEVLARTLA